MLVHTLEHGRIDVQYKEGTSAGDVAKLEAFLGETDGYHMLLFQNTTGMDAAVAATAWGHSLTCPKMNDKTFDALRTFRDSLHRQGPRVGSLGRARRRARHELDRQHDLPRARVLRRIDEQPAGGQPLLQQRLADGRETARLRGGDVVEADDREVGAAGLVRGGHTPSAI